MQLEQALAHAADLDDPFVAGLIERIVDNEEPGAGAQLALKRIRRALRGFDQAAIHTIHAFCQRALREAPFAAAMPFALETEADDTALRFDVAAQFWRERIEPEAARTPGFAQWLVARGAGPATLQALLAQRIKKPLAELVWTDPACDAAADVSIDHFGRAGELWRDECEQIAQRLSDGGAQLNQRTHKPSQLQAALAAWERYFARGDRYAPVPEGALKLTASALAAASKAKCKPPVHPFFDQADALVAAQRDEHALHLRRWFVLVREWLSVGPRHVVERKRAARILSFDDLLANLHDALHVHPWLADALRERYPAALIDEFQDTDPLQFEIFNRIFAPRGPLFLVGDPKQAIYSFRAADLHTYLDARAHAAARYTLAVNQRSSPALITACNRLFGANPHAFVLDGLDYHPVRAGTRPRPPFVDRHDPLDAARAGAADLRVWWLPDRAPLSKRDAERACADACAAEIARLLLDARAGDAIIGAEPLAPANIAVLVQTHRQGTLMKRVLRARGIGSVELAQASVFASIDAEQLERILLAIDTPGELRRLRAALATDWIGLDAAALREIEPSEPGACAPGCEPVSSERDVASWVERFARYRLLWHERGFAPMWRAVMRELRIAQRLANAEEGERRLTDVNHLAELIQARESEQSGIAPTLRWLGAQRADPGVGEETQLRLESDRDLVQIVTVHKSKGLEYPVVFCPFLTNGALRAGPAPATLPVAREYHRDDGVAVLHFGCDGDETRRVERRMMREQAAERARLIYVALTRAVYRCYLVAGVYTTGAYASTKQARQSVLNWLVAGASMPFDAWLDEPPELDELAACWRALQRDDGDIVVMPLPAVGRRDPLPPAGASRVDVRARVPTRRLFETWRTMSFSLLASARPQSALGVSDMPDVRPDHDERVADVEINAIALAQPAAPSSATAELRDDDILHFPRGPAAGDCLHRLMELANLRDPSSWPFAIERALAERPPNSHELPAERLKAMMARLLRDLADAPLESRFTLRQLDPSRWLTELEFIFPVATLDMRRFAAMLAEHGIADMALNDSVLHGYLKGFIDAVVEFGGQFWIIDWKSNYLGDSPHAYRAGALSAAMNAHAYRLQALIYTIALHRYLRARLPGYDYDMHFGASLYLFVRGVRPDWPGAGIERFRPARAVVDAFDALFSARGRP
ncbi:hypothetical protein DFQ28_004023 [Apophysomyces sp. BC1034]|nr:hypothetical protein DFQ28_004023 [Apophysomyces sp. BC1034]